MIASNDPLILRHLDDIEDFRIEDRNTTILPDELKKVPQIASKINERLIYNEQQRVHFISSPQLRAQDTLKAVVAELRSKNHEVKITTQIDERIRDLYHGKYTVPGGYQAGDKMPAVGIANKAYVKETFNGKNLDYHNGDVLNGRYQELTGLFSGVGETQRNFSIRFYNFIDDFLTLLDRQPDTLYIIVTHTAIVFRIFELVALFNNMSEEELKTVPIGDLTFYEWDAMKYLPHSPGKLFVSPGELKYLNSTILKKYHACFSGEVKFLIDHDTKKNS